MASSFDRWEKDPFFSGAEEVQESADRMESTYRTWVHAKKNSVGSWDSDELRRDLQTALGTTKWQLEEFERAVRSSYARNSNDDARDRHREFIVAIEDQISRTQSSLQQSAISEGKPPLPWVRLDEGECNELALFLSGPTISDDKSSVNNHHSKNKVSRNTINDPSSNILSDLHGHRRAASASAYIGSLEISIMDDVHTQNSSSTDQPPLPPRKTPSFSGFLSTMDISSKFKWPKNVVRKCKTADRQQEADTPVPSSSHLTRGIDACYEKSKSCLDGCDDCYHKQLNGWYGAMQRRLQRSQYQMRYSRPVHAAVWIVLFICLIVLIARAT